MIKQGEVWMINGNRADSSKTINYLSRLANLSNNQFVDTVRIAPDSPPTFSVNITTSDLEFIEVKGYKDSTSFLIHSSQNPDAIFDGASLAKSIFVGKSSFKNN